MNGMNEPVVMPAQFTAEWDLEAERDERQEVVDELVKAVGHKEFLVVFAPEVHPHVYTVGELAVHGPDELKAKLREALDA